MPIQYERLSKVIAKSLAISETELKTGFRLATKAEIPAVSQMRQQVFTDAIKADDPAYLEWRYFARSGFPSTLWVFELNGVVIAAMGTEPVTIDKQGEKISAIRNMDAIVHPDYDNRGLGAWMVLSLQQTYDCVLVSGGNQNSTSMLKKMFTALPVRKNYKLLFKSNAFLAEKMPRPLAALLSPFVNFGLDIFLLTKWSPLEGIKGITIKDFSSVEAFLKELNDHPNVLGNIGVVRDKAYLEWRYQQNPRTQFSISAAYKAGEIIAFVIYSFHKKNETESYSRGRLVDWCVYDKTNATALLACLFKQASWELKKLGAEQVFLVLNEAVSATAAQQVGFSLRNVDSRFFVFHKHLAEHDALFSAKHWFQSMSDSDGV
ncbi:MAG: hypothetical protein ACMZ64_01590 [Oleiphilus sp.]